MHNSEENVQLNSSASSTKMVHQLWQVLWWVIAVLAAISVGLWLYIWWLWQRTDPTSLETWHVLISAIVPLITGLLGWLNAQTVSPDGPTVLVELVGNLLNAAIQRWHALFYRKSYLADLVRRVHDSDTTDLTIQRPVPLAAEQIYVEPHLKVSPVDTIAPSILSPHEEEIDEQCHSIWHYLQQYAKLRNTVGPRPLVLLAGPGYGKSALLHHIVHVVSSNWQTRKRYLAPRKLPILLRLRLREVEKLVANTPINTTNPADSYSRDYTLPQAIADSIYANGGPRPPQDWFSRQLRKGSCLVLLDGLDEIPNPLVQAQVIAWINHQRRNFYRNQFLLTSRPLAYQDTPLEGATTIAIMPLATNQIRELIQRWYRAAALVEAKEMTPPIERAIAQQAQGLIYRIGQSPALLRMAQNPLLLTMILHVYIYKKDALPEKRVTLLDEACVVLFERRPEQPKASPKQKQIALQPLAYALQQKRVAEIELQTAAAITDSALQSLALPDQALAFLEGIRRGSGLLLIENQKLFFAHLIFQSYLSACHVTQANLLEDLVANLDDNWWRETILLYCALNDATPVVQACLSPATISTRRFRLALECLNEANRVSPAVLSQVAKIVSSGMEDKTARTIMRKALAEIREEGQLRLTETKYVGSALVTHTEYQIFLFDQYDRGHYHQPDHWLDRQFPADQAMSPAVGIRAQDSLAFCAWLNEQETTKTWRFRLPNHTDVEEESVLAALKHPAVNYWIGDQHGYVCQKPVQIPAPSFDTIKSKIIDDVRRQHTYTPAALFSVNINLLSPTEAVTLMNDYDFNHRQLTTHIAQIRSSLTQAMQNASNLTSGLRLASEEFRRQAEEHRQASNRLDFEINHLHSQIQMRESKRDDEIQDLTKHYQQQYSQIDNEIDQQQAEEKILLQRQDVGHTRLTQEYEALYAKIATEIQSLHAHIAENNTITAKIHITINQDYKQIYDHIEEQLRQAENIYAKNQTIHEENLRKISISFNHHYQQIDRLIEQYERKISQFESMDKTQYDVTAAVASQQAEISRLQGERNRIADEEQAERQRTTDAANATFQQNRNVIADHQQRRREQEAKEEREHADNDQDTRTKNAQIEKIMAEYEQQQRQYQAQEKERHAAIDSRTNAQNKQIHDAINHYERERERLRNTERQQINEIRHRYDPFLQDARNAVKELARNQSEQVNAETIAQHRANRCTEFPDTIVKPLKTALSSLDDFAHASQDFFSDANSLAIATEQQIKQVMTETGELANFLNEIASTTAASVTIYQQALENIQQTLLSAKSIIYRRDKVKEMLTVIYDRVEHSNIEPLTDTAPLDRINRHLRVTIDEIQGFLSDGNRKLNLQADSKSALQRLAYMRLLLLTGTLCLLDATKGERHSPTVVTRLLEQYMKLILIEDRMCGAVPAYEGIRLIKEYIAKPLS